MTAVTLARISASSAKLMKRSRPRSVSWTSRASKKRRRNRPRFCVIDLPGRWVALAERLAQRRQQRAARQRLDQYDRINKEIDAGRGAHPSHAELPAIHPGAEQRKHLQGVEPEEVRDPQVSPACAPVHEGQARRAVVNAHRVAQ